MVGRHCLLLILLAALAAPALTLDTSALAQQAGFPYWVSPGLHVAYAVMAGTATLSQMEDVEQAVIDVGGAGIEPEPVTIYSSASATGVTMIGYVDHYVVASVSREEVRIYYSSWTTEIDTGAAAGAEGLPERVETTVKLRVERPFNGPFWIDPALLRNARAGGTVVIAGEDGKPITYLVVLAGRYDISPLSKDENTLTARTGVELAIPVPPGTVREIVMLKSVQREPIVGKFTKTVVRELIVDRETGLILYEGYTEIIPPLKPRDTAKQTVRIRVLAEINMDLEDRLPSYREKSYDYGPLLHTGYTLGVLAQLLPEAGLLTSPTYTIGHIVLVNGIYKDRALVRRAEIVGVVTGTTYTPPTATVYMDLVGIETGETTVLERIDINLGSQGLQAEAPKPTPVDERYPLGILVLPRNGVGAKTITVYGVPYKLAKTLEVEIPGLGKTKIYAYVATADTLLGGLAFAETREGGVLVALSLPEKPGYSPKVLGQAPNTAQYLARLTEALEEARGKPGWEDIGGVDGGHGGGQNQQDQQGANGGEKTQNTTLSSAVGAPGAQAGRGSEASDYTITTIGGGIAAAAAIIAAALILVAKRRAQASPPLPPPPPS